MAKVQTSSSIYERNGVSCSLMLILAYFFFHFQLVICNLFTLVFIILRGAITKSTVLISFLLNHFLPTLLFENRLLAICLLFCFLRFWCSMFMLCYLFLIITSFTYILSFCFVFLPSFLFLLRLVYVVSIARFCLNGAV